MREIKFRGMDINGDWHYGLVGYKSTTLLPGGKTGWFISDIDGSPWAYQVRPETIGQCTGLKDKNSRLIYEGDIVELTDGCSFEKPIKTKVRWVEEDTCFALLGSNNLYYKFWYFDSDSLEVIGDIHKNPELLEDNNVH